MFVSPNQKKLTRHSIKIFRSKITPRCSRIIKITILNSPMNRGNTVIQFPILHTQSVISKVQCLQMCYKVTASPCRCPKLSYRGSSYIHTLSLSPSQTYGDKIPDRRSKKALDKIPKAL